MSYPEHPAFRQAAGVFKPARELARSIAQGERSYASVLEALQHTAALACPKADQSGLQIAIAQTLNDEVAHWDRLRRQAEWSVIKAVRPLVEALSADKPIWNAAYAANAALGRPLLREEVHALVVEHVEQFKRFNK